jgi:hypothetical protein
MVLLRPKKTGSTVAIPLHNFIVEILKKRDGQLPVTVNDVIFNSR